MGYRWATIGQRFHVSYRKPTRTKEQDSVVLSKIYVNDSLVTLPNTESATDFLQVLNKVHPSLSITMELEHDGSIPFLNTGLTRFFFFIIFFIINRFFIIKLQS